MKAAPEFPLDVMTVMAWPEDEVGSAGHDARTRYVERYWLGVLGPSATWILRYAADELEASPNGFIMHMSETAQQMGLSENVGRNSPFVRALGRLCQFEMAKLRGNVLLVRRRVPNLSRRHLLRLTDRLQNEHSYLQQRSLEDAS